MTNTKIANSMDNNDVIEREREKERRVSTFFFVLGEKPVVVGGAIVLLLLLHGHLQLEKDSTCSRCKRPD